MLSLGCKARPGGASNSKSRGPRPCSRPTDMRTYVRMWHDDQRSRALRLVRDGRPDAVVARRRGIPRSTIARWRRHPEPQRSVRRPNPAWRPGEPTTYCYLLGLYLGDGCISINRSTVQLRITCDALYGDLVAQAANALGVLFPESTVCRFRHPVHRKVDVQITDPSLVFAFPQHGQGRKHKRPIELLDWQLECTHAHPEHLIRGLIHSDGCRTVNRFSTKLPSGRIAMYEYPRYFFSNLSADIREIFCRHCDLLGIRWTRSNPRNISVSHRGSVALLDSFVGPKR